MEKQAENVAKIIINNLGQKTYKISWKWSK